MAGWLFFVATLKIITLTRNERKKMKRKFLLGLVIVLLVVSFKSTSYATKITSALGVLSNTFGEWSSTIPIANVSNQTGLSMGFVSGVTDWNTYFTGNPNHSPSAVNEWWGSQGVLQGSIVFDLGSSYLVDKIAIWNEEYNGIYTFNVLTSNDGISFASVGSSFYPTDWNNTSSLPYDADIFSLTPTMGQYVRLDITGVRNAVTMGEIVFSTSNSTIPEPSSILLLGFGMVGLAGVARKKMAK